MLGSKALLIVDGTAPKTVAPGDTHRGVKVISTSGDEAVVEIAGKRHLLRVGDAPASVGGAVAVRGNRIVLTAGSGGHFTTQGTINGQSVQFLVDTGATSIAMGAPEAERIGLNYKSGQNGLGQHRQWHCTHLACEAELGAHRRRGNLRRRRFGAAFGQCLTSCWATVSSAASR